MFFSTVFFLYKWLVFVCSAENKLFQFTYSQRQNTGRALPILICAPYTGTYNFSTYTAVMVNAVSMSLQYCTRSQRLFSETLQFRCLYNQIMHRWRESYQPRMPRRNVFTTLRKTKVFTTRQRTSCSRFCVHLLVATLFPAAFKRQSIQSGFINISIQNKSISFLGEHELGRN